jgi:hypothetical protein
MSTSIATATAANMSATLARKLSKVLETSIESNEDFVKSLRDLSSFYAKNSIVNRRNLRGEIERRGLEVNQEFLQLIQGVQKVCTMNERFEKTDR